MNANSISRGGRSEVTPNLETVAEVRVVANNFSAVQGRNMGTQVSVVTKSGTNELHGAVWEYHRNNDLQSRNLFQSAVPVYRTNQFGVGVQSRAANSLYEEQMSARLNYWRSAIYVAVAHLYLSRTAETFLRSL